MKAEFWVSTFCPMLTSPCGQRQRCILTLLCHVAQGEDEGDADMEGNRPTGKSHLAAVLHVMEENLKTRIISRPDDEVALIFFNTVRRHMQCTRYKGGGRCTHSRGLVGVPAEGEEERSGGGGGVRFARPRSPNCASHPLPCPAGRCVRASCHVVIRRGSGRGRHRCECRVEHRSTRSRGCTKPQTLNPKP